MALFCNSPSSMASAASEAVSGPYIGLGIMGLTTVGKFVEQEEKDDQYITATPKASAITPNVVLGWRFSEYLKADLNLQLRRFKYSAKRHLAHDIIPSDLSVKQKIESKSLFFNTFLSAPKMQYLGIQPYATAGVGYSYNSSSELILLSTVQETIIFPGKKSQSIAWNVGAGVTLALLEDVDLDIGYKFMDLGVVRTAGTFVKGLGWESPRPKRLKTGQAAFTIVYRF